MKTGSINVQTENIFPIIKKFLYSDHEIFLRELVSNAVDASQKLKFFSTNGEFTGALGDLKVEVIINAEEKTLTIRDNGIGMTENEIDKYINQIAFSGAEEFVQKYKGKEGAEQIIGHFGLGFYSSFMVSDKVQIKSLSHKEGSQAVQWESNGSPEFTIEEIEKTEIGTDIVLFISDESAEFLKKERIQGMLDKYCKFLSIPVFFGSKTEYVEDPKGEKDESGKVKRVAIDVENQVNNVAPAWTKKPADLTTDDYNAFYRELYPTTMESPLFHIHLNVDYPFNLTGVLYFPKLQENIEVQKNKINLYSNQVFITDNVEQIVPEFLTLLHGVIDSPDIPLNVSRSYLQADGNVKKIASHITKKVADKSKSLEKKSALSNSSVFFIENINEVNLSSDFNSLNESLEVNNIEALDYKKEDRPDYFRDILGFLLPIIILIAIFMFVMRKMSGGAGGGAGGQIFNIGKSKAKLYDNGKTTNITFNDVAGLEGAKEEVEEIVEFLKNSKKYTDLGAKIPKGALLVGPPGTGKTLLAKAVAGEAKVPFFSLSGSDFVEMFVGVGASRVRDLFKQAKEKSPSIIFIDEIDAIGRARGKNNGLGSNDERENTLNQLLTEMDGFETNSGVIILAATNRAEVLDEALTRAGRFDRQIFVDMPDLNERREIFAVHLKPLKLEPNIDVEFLSKQTPGFSGADIANLCNEAALIAARKDKKQVEKQDFLDAVDRIVGGLEKKNKIITPEEKKSIAYHEAGHATISWMLEHAHPLVKVTIVPRGRSLGAAWYLPEERSITTTEQILDDICSALGGRAAELITFGKISTGALSDLEKVTKQAYAMVSVYGLNNKIGNISYYDPNGSQFTKPYSDETARIIDSEVSILIEKQYDRAVKILTENKDKLAQLAEKLLDKEVIFKEDLIAIFGERIWDKEEEIIEKAEVVESTPLETDASSDSAEESAETKTDDNETEIKDVKEDLDKTDGEDNA